MSRSFGHEDAGLATADSLGRIVTNFSIDSFLESNDKRYLVGPKGTGKTLLLLRKAIDQRGARTGLCIPSDPSNPVDRLTAAQNVGRKFNQKVSDSSENQLAWATVWKNSIYRSILHHIRDRILQDIMPSESDRSPSWKLDVDVNRLKSAKDLLESSISGNMPRAPGPFFYFTDLGAKLDSSKHNAIDDVRIENMKLEELLRLERSPIYVFLDNLDDYYEREPSLWFNSMYGQFRAVREIGLVHRNIHIFTSIRQDVYKQFGDEMRLQYFDYVATLEYTKDQLLRIFEYRINALDDDLLRHPGKKKSDPWEAFFGSNRKIMNDVVGVAEDIADYIYRHTLGRPRDMIHVGTVLLARLPPTVHDSEHIKEAILAAEEDIAEQYLAEIAPLLDDRFQLTAFVHDFVPSNVIPQIGVSSIESKYLKSKEQEIFNPDVTTDLHRPLATMYELGLLGVIRQKNESTSKVQFFESPGHGLPAVEARRLPESDLYLLHPALNFLIDHNKRSRDILVGQGLPA